MHRLALSIVLLAAILAAGAPVSASARTYVETEGPRPWYTLLRPAQHTPAEQLAYARALRDRGSLRRAHRHYRALVASWPSSEEAPTAQLEHAQLLDRRGRAEDAFEAYQKLMDRFPGLFPFESVIARQLRIAEELLERRRFRFLFGGFTSPERAIPLLEKIAANAPTQLDAVRARMLVGRAHQAIGEIGPAGVAFAEVEQRFPDSPFAVEAAFRRAECLDEMARRSPSDRQLVEEAWFAFERFLRMHADSEFADAARTHRDRLYRRRARMAWEQASFYDRRGGQPAAAIGPYERFLEEFPDTEWAPQARERMEALRPRKEQDTP